MNIRFGILGAARIAPAAIVRPVTANRRTSLAAVASRTPEHARRFAEQHGIPTAHSSMEALLEDDTVDACYIALPNSEHTAWAIRALEAGKHVLVEKPAARNEAEAERLAAAAASADRVCMVGFHNRHHAFFAQVRELLPTIGTLESVTSRFHINLERRDDIRLDYELGGGALMDLGCYELQFLRALIGVEPAVIDAEYVPADDDRVDQRMDAHLQYGTVRASISSALFEPEESQRVHFRGSQGDLIVDGFVLPHRGNRIHLAVPGARHDHHAPTERTTYDDQLTRFIAAIHHDRGFSTTPAESVGIMRDIDAIYLAAGLPLR